MNGMQQRSVRYPLAVIDELANLPITPPDLLPDLPDQVATKRYADNAIATAVGGVVFTPVRQAITKGPVDASKQAAHLGVGSGLTPQLLGATTPVRMTFADGFGDTGAIDYQEKIAANTSFPALDANQINHLFAQRVSAGNVTLGATLIPFQHGPSFDIKRHCLLDFEGANNSTTITDAYGNAWTAVNDAKLTTTSPLVGTSSLTLDGTGDCIYTNAITSFLNGVFTFEFWVNFAATPSSGNSVGLIYARNGSGYGFKIDLLNTAGTLRLNIDMSSNGSSNNIANSQNGTKTTWSTGTTYKIAITWDGATYRYFVDGVVDYSTANANPICPITELILGAKTTAGSGGLNGKMDNFRMNLGGALYVAAYTPGSTQLTPLTWWFDTVNQQMFFGAPGGTMPWTATPALYLGRAITGGASVSSVEPVPLLNYYDSDWFDISGSTSYTKTHNFGHDLYERHVQARNKQYPNEAKDLKFDGTNGGYNTHKGPKNIIERIATLSTSADFTRLYTDANASRSVAVDQARILLVRTF